MMRSKKTKRSKGKRSRKSGNNKKLDRFQQAMKRSVR